MARLISTLKDNVVKGSSNLVEMTTREYLALAQVIIDNNEFQRRRVRSSKSIYSLLRRDIRLGCVMPPIVLALRSPVGRTSLVTHLTDRPGEFVILDGLQRSFTLLDVLSELEAEGDRKVLDEFLKRKIRCEIYGGVNRAGILYRMLTLNTGQTTMSLRHQIEIMYLDYLSKEIEGVSLVREADGKSATKLNEYNFKEMIEGFNSYIDRNELPMDRGDVLDNIASLENLSIENNKADLFTTFITTWHAFITKIDSLNIEFVAEDDDDAEFSEESRLIWGSNGVRIFKRPQAVSGFGAAIGLLRGEGEFKDLSKIKLNVKVGADDDIFVLRFNEAINKINSNARKIGNAQRLFFRVYFKMLFMKSSPSYLDLFKSIEVAVKGAERLGI